MISFVISLILLVLGFVIYGRIVENVFGVSSYKRTPCYSHNDGIDYSPMPTWKVFMIQFLNIAGTGPIFGAVMGILFGPAAYLWIVLGCIFGGATHDYLAGMLSLRRDGASLPEIIGDELGKRFRLLMRIVSMVLMVIVGTVFASTPAGLLANVTSGWGMFGSIVFWTVVIYAYYLLATLLPINKIIGKVYPIFGLALLVMAMGVLFGIFINEGELPEVTTAFTNHHPSGALPLFPGIFVTIACGAISGFHATQSPMMARCIKHEKLGRTVFYGAMITEGLVALIWAAAAIKFADTLNVAGDTPYEKLLTAMTVNGKMNPAIIVNAICNSWLGKVGAVIAIIGIVGAPITTGDTAFRTARLITADFMHVSQEKISYRLALCLPIFAISIFLMVIDFAVIWRYLAWLNQTLAVFTLWALTVWLSKEKKCYVITLIPAIFMTMVCSSYILVAPEGFSLDHNFSFLVAGIATLVATISFYRWKNHKNIKQ